MATGLAKITRAVDGDGEALSAEEYMQLCTTVYCMCTQAPPHNYSQQLYERYKEDLDDYIKSTVLPSLSMHGEVLLRELVDSWRKHNLIFSSQIKLFRYLNRYYISRKPLPPLQELSSNSFHDLVFNQLKSTVTMTVIAIIDDEKEGQFINRDLLKNVLDIYVQIGSGNLDVYQVDFEQAFLKAARTYYSKKVRTWILVYSHADYMLKVEECLQKREAASCTLLAFFN